MASDSEQIDALAAGIETMGAGVVEYQVQGLRVRRAENPMNHVKAMLLLRGLSSSKRGFSVAQIDDATAESE